MRYRENACQMKARGHDHCSLEDAIRALGVGGLEGRHQGSKLRTATPAAQVRVIRRVQQKPDEGALTGRSGDWRRRWDSASPPCSGFWPWLQAQLQPQRLECYMASNDPECEAKAANIPRLYLDPRQHCGREDRDSGLGEATACGHTMKPREVILGVSYT